MLAIRIEGQPLGELRGALRESMNCAYLERSLSRAHERDRQRERRRKGTFVPLLSSKLTERGSRARGRETLLNLSERKEIDVERGDGIFPLRSHKNFNERVCII